MHVPFHSDKRDSTEFLPTICTSSRPCALLSLVNSH